MNAYDAYLHARDAAFALYKSDASAEQKYALFCDLLKRVCRLARLTDVAKTNEDGE